MSTLTMSSGMAGRSNLNPNAPLFVPMAFQQVEDFSPEWWDLVKTTAWYRDYWFHQHQELENFGHEEDEDVVNLLPDSFDLGIDDQLAFSETQFHGSADYQTVRAEEAPISIGLQGEKFNHGSGVDVARVSFEQAKHYQKPMQSVAPKYSSQFIQQTH